MNAARAKTKEQQQATSTATTQPETLRAISTTTSASSKRDAVFAQLKSAWAQRGMDVSKVSTRFESQGQKFVVVTGLPENWPRIEIGIGGGVSLPGIRSYESGLQAAIHGDEVLAKQVARDRKRAETASPKPQVDAAKQPEAKPQTKPSVATESGRKTIN